MQTPKWGFRVLCDCYIKRRNQSLQWWNELQILTDKNCVCLCVCLFTVLEIIGRRQNVCKSAEKVCSDPLHTTIRIASGYRFRYFGLCLIMFQTWKLYLIQNLTEFYNLWRMISLKYFQWVRVLLLIKWFYIDKLDNIETYASYCIERIFSNLFVAW